MFKTDRQVSLKYFKPLSLIFKFESQFIKYVISKESIVKESVIAAI